MIKSSTTTALPVKKKRRVTLVDSPTKPVAWTSGTAPTYEITHPMYDRFLPEYTTDYIVTDQIKTSLSTRVETMNLTKQDIETIFIIIMTHTTRNPIKDFIVNSSLPLPYGGKQLKTKEDVTFQIETMPDQLVFILHKFLDYLDDDARSQIDESDIPQLNPDDGDDGEYNTTNLGYAAIN